MGCDIHLHTEVKINGKWEHYGAPSISRSYDLFGKMAGVRRDVEPIAQPKGVPSDLSAVTAFDYAKWGSGAHTPSWLDAAETPRCASGPTPSSPMHSALGWTGRALR